MSGFQDGQNEQGPIVEATAVQSPVVEPVTLDIFLRGGGVVSLNVKDWSVTRGQIEGDLRQFHWTTTAGGATFAYLDLASVEAIVERALDTSDPVATEKKGL